MKGSNKISYQDEDIKLARFARALVHPARIAIIRRLASLETCCFTKISDVLPLATSTVSQHLTELKKAGLIQGNIESPKVRYCINYENWILDRNYLKEFTGINIFKYEKDK